MPGCVWRRALEAEMDFASKIRSALADCIGQERFELWFDDVTINHGDSSLQVVVRTTFLRDRLRRDFQKTIGDVAAKLGYGDLLIEFIVDADMQSPPTRHESGKRCEEAAVAVAMPGATQPQRKPLLLAASQPARRSRFRTFDSFVDGECNRLARTSSQMVVDQPGEVTPLVVHGPTGVGKTHLMEAIWCLAKKQRRARVVYLSAEQFTTYFVEALKGSGLPAFRRKYRQADVLMIDDIQFFERKQATLVELAYTIDELSRENRQLVLTADRPPAQLASSLGRDIVNRLCGGLVCAMKPIDCQTMERISTQWANERQTSIDPAIHAMLASRMQGDARQLSGVLNRLRAASIALNEPITMRMANEVLFELVPAQAKIIRLQDVRKAICDVFGLDTDHLQQQSRSRAITQPRMLAMYLARKYTSAGLHEISQFFGRRSHSSAVTASNTVDAWIANGEKVIVNGQTCDVRDIVSQVERSLRAG